MHIHTFSYIPGLHTYPLTYIFIHFHTHFYMIYVKTCTGHLNPSNRLNLVCIGFASPAIIFLDCHSGHQCRHKSAYRIPAKTRQPISISRHIFHDSRICSGAIKHGVLQTRSRRSRRAITRPLATSVMNANTSSPQRRRTRTPLNHVLP